MLTTERLILRRLQNNDAANLFAIFSDPDVMHYWSTPLWSDILQARVAIAEAADESIDQESISLGIVLRAEGKLIGTIKLYAMFRENRRCSIGYALARNYWGRGYIAESLDALLDDAFGRLDLNRIEADVDCRNVRSEKVLQRAGFQQEGLLRERWIVHGSAYDSTVYALLRRDWRARAERVRPVAKPGMSGVERIAQC